LFAPPKEQEPLVLPNSTQYRDHEVESDDEDDIDAEILRGNRRLQKYYQQP
jgi:hypothetical protein